VTDTTGRWLLGLGAPCVGVVKPRNHGPRRICQSLNERSGPALQLDALEHAGCHKVFVDKGSGARADRSELAAALAYCRQGDVLVC
jgi:Resolvase, N terminal domain